MLTDQPSDSDQPGNEAGFSIADLREWRKRLEALARELSAADTAAGDTGDAVELDQSKVGRLSRMDALQMQAMARAEAQRRQAHIQRINVALARVDEGIVGDYGLCRACEEAIDPKRLAVDPAALLCFACASTR